MPTVGSPSSVKLFDVIPRIAIDTPESDGERPTCIFGTRLPILRILLTPSRARASAVSAETASGVSIRLVSRLTAVTITSSRINSSAEITGLMATNAKRVNIARRNVGLNILYLLYFPQLTAWRIVLSPIVQQFTDPYVLNNVKTVSRTSDEIKWTKIDFRAIEGPSITPAR